MAIIRLLWKSFVFFDKHDPLLIFEDVAFEASTFCSSFTLSIIDSFRILPCRLLQDHLRFQNFYLLLYYYTHSWYIHLLHLDSDTFYYIFYNIVQSFFLSPKLV